MKQNIVEILEVLMFYTHFKKEKQQSGKEISTADFNFLFNFFMSKFKFHRKIFLIFAKD